MAGIKQDYLIKPILELVRSEIKHSQFSSELNTGTDDDRCSDFDGTPSVSLYRDHPLDTSGTFISSATLIFEKGNRIVMEISYLDTWELDTVTTQLYDCSGFRLVGYLIALNREEHIVTGTTVTKLDFNGNMDTTW